MTEENPTIIGDLRITLDANGDVELRTFERTARNVLSAEQALELLQWLSDHRDTLWRFAQQEGEQALGGLPE